MYYLTLSFVTHKRCLNRIEPKTLHFVRERTDLGLRALISSFTHKMYCFRIILFTYMSLLIMYREHLRRHHQVYILYIEKISNDTLKSTYYKQRTHDTLKSSYYIERTSHSMSLNLIIVYRNNLIRDT